MNTINIAIDFTNGTNRVSGISLITGDYASTKIVFQFDREDGTKVFEMKNPSGQIVYAGEIQNNEVILSGTDNGQNYSIFNEAGLYIYEVSLYDGDSKLTSTKGQLPVKKEQVIIGDETIEPYLPIFDQLMQQINTAITETNNLNITITTDASGTKTIVITNKSGQTTDAIIEDLQFHWNGTQLGIKTSSQEQYTYVDLQGPQGPAGAIKMEIVNPLPQIGNEDTIYLVPITKIQVETLPETGLPDTIYIIISTGKRYIYKNNQWEEETENNNFNEYIWVNNDWEPLGGINTEIDLTDYVKFTDYATSSKGGTIKISNASYGTNMDNGFLTAGVKTYEQYTSGGNAFFIGKGTLENVITGKGLTTKSYVDGLVGDIASVIDSINGESI